mgnify:CR=1 FL=1
MLTGGSLWYALSISKLLLQVNRVEKPFLLALFLVFGLLTTQLVFSHRGVSGEKGVFGGPIQGKSATSEESLATLYPAVSPTGSNGNENTTYNKASDALLLAGTVFDPGRPMGIFANRGGLMSYSVQKGDTLSGIADEFGISVQTITAANPKIRANALKVGEELNILPVSGVVYRVKGGENMEEITSLFGVSSEKIKEFNRAVDLANLAADTLLVIPGGKNAGSLVVARTSLPSLRGYFALPTQGFNWGALHSYNAVDIANVCGTPVNAAAEGLVVDAVSDGWNAGYGHAVLIEHPNETKTRYAHLDATLATIGDYVKQGQQIGTMGNTGNVHGPTGCHLHFEVEGAQNPFAK